MKRAKDSKAPLLRSPVPVLSVCDARSYSRVSAKPQYTRRLGSQHSVQSVTYSNLDLPVPGSAPGVLCRVWCPMRTLDRGGPSARGRPGGRPGSCGGKKLEGLGDLGRQDIALEG